MDATAGDESLEDSELGRIIKARLAQMAQEHEDAKAKPAPPCKCRKCPSCRHAMHLGFIGWLYDHGHLQGDDYPEPLSESDRERLARHVLP